MPSAYDMDDQYRLINSILPYFGSTDPCFIGLGCLALSLPKFLSASFGLLALSLTGLIFILLAVIALLFDRSRS